MFAIPQSRPAYEPLDSKVWSNGMRMRTKSTLRARTIRASLRTMFDNQNKLSGMGLRLTLLVNAMLLALAMGCSEPGHFQRSSESHCRSFVSELERDAEMPLAMTIEYRGRPRDQKRFMFCASLRSLGDQDGGDLLTRFDIAAQSLRAALMSQTDETAALSEAAREALREMAATVRVVNAAPMRD